MLPYNFAFLSSDERLLDVLSKPINIKPTAQFLAICYDERSKIVKASAQTTLFHTDPPENCLAGSI